MPAFIKHQHLGVGLLARYNDKPIEYDYWDDPNQLVERLKLLIATKNTGNRSN